MSKYKKMKQLIADMRLYEVASKNAARKVGGAVW